MSDTASIEATRLLSELKQGSHVALARAISHVESGGDVALALLDATYADAGHAARIGITGPPGTGKSTLVSCLATAMRASQPSAHLAVIAIDPSSPFTGGALLGDRFRMNELAQDPKVFIRSMASRGALGGLSEATESSGDLLETAGYSTILIETVGVGQNEVDIASACDTTVLVLNPEGGDTIQALKAGLMEIADIIVVNKADHPRTDRFLNDIGAALELKRPDPHRRTTPVIATIATRNEGTPEVLAALAAHRAHLAQHSLIAGLAERRCRRRLKQLWFAMFQNQALDHPAVSGMFENMVLDVMSRRISLYRAARELAALLLAQGSQTNRFSEETLGQAIAADRHPESSGFHPSADSNADTDTQKHLKNLGPKKR